MHMIDDQLQQWVDTSNGAKNQHTGAGICNSTLGSAIKGNKGLNPNIYV